MRRIGGSEVDIEASSIFIDVEADYSAIREEVRRLPYGENRGAAKGLQRCVLAPEFVLAEKEEIAPLRILQMA